MAKRKRTNDERIGRCAALVLRMVAELEAAGLRRHEAIDAVEAGLMAVVDRQSKAYRGFVNRSEKRQPDPRGT